MAVTPVQVPPTEGGLETKNPESVSVKVQLVSAVALGLVIVKVNEELR